MRAPLPLALLQLALIAMNMGHAWLLGMRGRQVSPALVTVLNALLIASVAQAFTPVAFAPTLAAITALVVALNARLASWARPLVFAAFVASVLVPWLLEAVGVAAPTVTVDDDGVRLFGSCLIGGKLMSLLTVVGSITVTIGVAVLVATRVQRADMSTRRKMHLQTWQLRQLVG